MASGPPRNQVMAVDRQGSAESVDRSIQLPRGLAARLSLGALGVSLVLFIAVAWGTGLVYLLARAGLPAPVGLAVNGAIHLYVGLVSVVFFGAKVLRVGLRRRVPGVAATTLWQRWISLSLLILYSGIYLTGLLAVLPLGSRLHGLAVNGHLLTSVWALVPTTLHLLHHRLRSLPFLTNFRQRRAPRRLWAGLGIALLAGLGFALAPRAVEPLAAAGAGPAWSPSGLDGVYLDRVVATHDGRLLAAGDGLYLSVDGARWRHVDLPSGNADAERLIDLGIKPTSNTPPPVAGGVHGGHANNVNVGVIQALAVSPTTGYVYLATADGMYYSPWPEGPYLALPFAGQDVRALALDPGSSYQVWATTASGPQLSIDGGHVWTPVVSGLSSAATATALAFFHGDAYVSEAGGVYRFDFPSVSWRRVFGADDVASLDPSADGRFLYASGLNGGLNRYDGRGWTSLDVGAAHNHRAAGHSHAHGITEAFGRLYATGTRDGVTASGDGGSTWTPLQTALPVDEVTGAIPFRGRLVAITTNGLYSIPAVPVPPPGSAWWTLLLFAAAVAGGAVVYRGALAPSRLRAA